MPNAISIWKQKYRLDFDVIDEQHLGFFEICGRVIQLCDSAKGAELDKRSIIMTIYELRAYAFKHFHTEESLLIRYRYPELYTHIQAHDAYLKAMRDFTSDMETDAKNHTDHAFLKLATRIGDYALNWWQEHILETDKRYIPHLKRAMTFEAPGAQQPPTMPG